jgi:uncharacterized protein (DUF849 family)
MSFGASAGRYGRHAPPTREGRRHRPADGDTAVANELVAVVSKAGSPAAVLLHGYDASCWLLLRHAGSRGLQTRIGMEDTLVMPDGSQAPDNAALVTAALDLLARC